MKRSSWKTTLGGFLASLAPIAHNVLPPQYLWIADALASVGIGILGLSARDNGVTSEQAGAK